MKQVSIICLELRTSLRLSAAISATFFDDISPLGETTAGENAVAHAIRARIKNPILHLDMQIWNLYHQV